MWTKILFIFLLVLFSLLHDDEVISPFLHEPDGLLHKISEISFLQSERVAPSVKLFLDDAQLVQLPEMFDTAVVVTSCLPRYG
jgi:hypothetical protein